MATMSTYKPHPQGRLSLTNLRSMSIWRQSRDQNSMSPRMIPAPGQQQLAINPDKMTADTIESVLEEKGKKADLDIRRGRQWTPGQETILLAPYNYLLQQKGKNIRGQLIQAFNEWLQVPAEKLEKISVVVEMLHTASLLVDDIEDFSTLRRGIPVAHSIYGEPQTINSANYVYFLALQEVLKLDNPNAVSIFCEELMELHRGQGLDLFWRDSFKCPTEEEYVAMVAQKTGGLFRLAIKLMQAESDCKLDLCGLADVIGVLFQIRDDYLNLASAQYSDAKGLCEDLTEGKFSFLIIHGIQADKSDYRLLNILQQRPRDDDVKKYAVSLLQQFGSFKYTESVIELLMERARQMVEEFTAEQGVTGKRMTAILNAMALDTSK
ncbi:isoprenoid synthase domain-containing protein [Macrophomina phaseolina]|uniref:Isoprenoid synthase domain-containing protein n=1 Tax=Macrophomina phaseolina TaxID=35725 RepID=A0ABQ8G8U5_9PEZI|nr:isoprenoid synthase domain-containing protein [Macrophomina phaseolina]